MSSPTQRSLAYMRKRGYLCAITERWNPHVGVRQDLFGFGDLLCVGDHEVVIVQTTTRSNMAARVRKIETMHLDEKRPHLGRMLDAVRKGGIRIIVHGWIKRRGRWHVREVDVS